MKEPIGSILEFTRLSIVRGAGMVKLYSLVLATLIMTHSDFSKTQSQSSSIEKANQAGYAYLNEVIFKNGATYLVLNYVELFVDTNASYEIAKRKGYVKNRDEFFQKVAMSGYWIRDTNPKLRQIETRNAKYLLISLFAVPQLVSVDAGFFSSHLKDPNATINFFWWSEPNNMFVFYEMSGNYIKKVQQVYLP